MLVSLLSVFHCPIDPCLSQTWHDCLNIQAYTVVLFLYNLFLIIVTWNKLKVIRLVLKPNTFYFDTFVNIAVINVMVLLLHVYVICLLWLNCFVQTWWSKRNGSKNAWEKALHKANRRTRKDMQWCRLWMLLLRWRFTLWKSFCWQ